MFRNTDWNQCIRRCCCDRLLLDRDKRRIVDVTNSYLRHNERSSSLFINWCCEKGQIFFGDQSGSSFPHIIGHLFYFLYDLSNSVFVYIGSFYSFELSYVLVRGEFILLYREAKFEFDKLLLCEVLFHALYWFLGS